MMIILSRNLGGWVPKVNRRKEATKIRAEVNEKD